MNKTTDDLEAKVFEKKRTRKILVGLGFIAFSAFSNILMPYEIINYYQHKKDYLEENSTEINPYLETAKKHASYYAGMLGTFWGLVNIGTFAAGLYLAHSAASTKRKEENGAR